MHLADAFIQSDLQLHSGYTFSLVHVFPGNIGKPIDFIILKRIAKGEYIFSHTPNNGVMQLI